MNGLGPASSRQKTPDRTPKLIEEFMKVGVRWWDKHPDKATPQRLSPSAGWLG
jgi:hypothetical protein